MKLSSSFTSDKNQKTMAAVGWLLSLAALFALGFAHDHSREVETHRVSAGSLFLLKCPNAGSDPNITWSRGGEQNQSLPAGAEVRDGILWFLPVQVHHDGLYTCEKREGSGLFGLKLRLSVSSGDCPEVSETISLLQNVSDVLPCKQTDISELNTTRSFRWMKDCSPVQHEVNDNGFMRLLSVSERDAGIYTCHVDISFEGRKFTSARSIRLTVIKGVIVTEPKVLNPQQEVVVVEVGVPAELNCKAYIGFVEDNDTSIYWTIDGTFAEDHKELHESWKLYYERGRVYGSSTLTFSKVHRHFLNVPIGCHIITTTAAADGLVTLQEADHSALYTSVALCILIPLILLIPVASLLFFKVELVLAYRNLSGRFAKQKAPDGKLYDAYVSFLHTDSPSSVETMKFALKTLPEELERKHGYSLYIRGRDDCPGEALHDAVAAALSQSRRLILIVSPEVKADEVPIHHNTNQLCYEHQVALYDALTQNSPRVILIEIDGPVDYSRLPESLRYIKRKKGALQWKKPSAGSHKPRKLDLNRNMWKNLRYLMPSVPAGRHAISV